MDMAGRKVEVPDRITKIFAATPPALCLLYAMNPDLIAGLNFPLNEIEKAYLRKDIAELPVIGGWFGQGRIPNLENVLMVRPDIMLVWLWKNSASNELVESTAKTLGLPVVYVKCDTIADYAAAFLFLGDLLGLEERGEALSSYTRRVLNEVQPVVQGIPEESRVPVYYAEGVDGLRTECSESTHALLIPMAGGRNIHQCPDRDSVGLIKISIEQVMLGEPEVMLVYDPNFLTWIKGQPQWGMIPAVRNKRVYLIPRAPFNWFDRPPSFMRILGLQWLTNLLYPDLYPKDIVAEAKDFYSLFLGLDLSDEEIKSILQ